MKETEIALKWFLTRSNRLKIGFNSLLDRF